LEKDSLHDVFLATEFLLEGASAFIPLHHEILPYPSDVVKKSQARVHSNLKEQ
jgi:hypothetical protein